MVMYPLVLVCPMTPLWVCTLWWLWTLWCLCALCHASYGYKRWWRQDPDMSFRVPSGGCEPCNGYELSIGYEPCVGYDSLLVINPWLWSRWLFRVPSGGCEPCDGYELFIGYDPCVGYEFVIGYEPLVMNPLAMNPELAMNSLMVMNPWLWSLWCRYWLLTLGYEPAGYSACPLEAVNPVMVMSSLLVMNLAMNPEMAMNSLMVLNPWLWSLWWWYALATDGESSRIVEKKKQKQQILITGEQVFKSDMSCWYLPLTLLRYDFGVYRLPHGNVVSRFSFILHSSIALGWSYLRWGLCQALFSQWE